jgi:HK97 family phage prohead protease
MTFETRTVAAEFEMRDDSTTGAPIFEGYASVFNQPYDMGPFWEQVDPSAFKRTLASGPDVRLLIDHEGQPLARTKSGTLELSTDDHGLHVRSALDPSDPDVQRLLPKMRRGDLSEMSFAFRVAPDGDVWEHAADRTTRTLRELSLQGGDVSVVTYPASPTTSATLRSKDLDAARRLYVYRMARDLHEGRALSNESIAKLQSILAELSTADEAIDNAQTELAAVIGVPDPDADEVDNGPRGIHPDTAKRLLAAADQAIRAA